MHQKKEEVSCANDLQEISSSLNKFENRQAALEAERAAARRSNAPLIDLAVNELKKLKVSKKHRKNKKIDWI